MDGRDWNFICFGPHAVFWTVQESELKINRGVLNKGSRIQKYDGQCAIAAIKEPVGFV